MKVIDETIANLINLSTEIPLQDIYNYYDLNGVMPQRVTKDYAGKKILIPYKSDDSFVVFGVEEVSEASTNGLFYKDDNIILLNRFLIKLEFNGSKADQMAYKMKALMFSNKCREYLEDRKISINTLNPKISSTNEVIGEELWLRRGLEFEITIELWYDNTRSISTDTGDIILKNINNERNE